MTAEQEKRQQRIIERGNGYDAYEFARDVPGADIAALQQVVIERGDGYDAYEFARNVKGADIAALQQVVLEKGNFWDAIELACFVPSADVPALQESVIEKGNSGIDFYVFARFVPGADIAKLFDAAEAVGFAGLRKEQVAEFRTLHAQSVSADASMPDGQKERELERYTSQKFVFDAHNFNADDYHEVLAQQTKQLQEQQQIIEHGDGRDAFQFARDTPGADIAALQRVVLEKGDVSDCFHFAAFVPNSDIAPLQQRVKNEGDNLELFMFASTVPGADVQSLHAEAKKRGFEGLNSDQIERFNTFAEQAANKEPVLFQGLGSALKRGIDRACKLIASGAAVAVMTGAMLGGPAQTSEAANLRDFGKVVLEQSHSHPGRISVTPDQSGQVAGATIPFSRIFSPVAKAANVVKEQAVELKDQASSSSLANFGRHAAQAMQSRVRVAAEQTANLRDKVGDKLAVVVADFRQPINQTNPLAADVLQQNRGPQKIVVVQATPSTVQQQLEHVAGVPQSTMENRMRPVNNSGVIDNFNGADDLREKIVSHARQNPHSPITFTIVGSSDMSIDDVRAMTAYAELMARSAIQAEFVATPENVKALNAMQDPGFAEHVVFHAADTNQHNNDDLSISMR